MDKLKCRFYDNGHGNGSYISGSSCGPPNCSFPNNKLKDYPKCNGIFKKCSINKSKTAKLKTLEIIRLEEELRNIKSN